MMILLFFATFMFASIQDIKTGEISNINHFLLLIIYVLQIYADLNYILNLFLAVVICSVLVFLSIRCENSIGGGDIKLIFAASCCLGYLSLYALLIACLTAFSYSKIKHLKNIRFAPFLAIGYVPLYIIQLAAK